MIKQSNIDLLQFAADRKRMRLEAITDLIEICYDLKQDGEDDDD